jgi:hypothetical protein
MEAAFVLLAGLVLIFPVIAVVALVKAGKVRDLLEQSITQNNRELAFLRTEIERVQRELKQVQEREAKAAVASPLAAGVESQPQIKQPAPEPKPIATPAAPTPPIVAVAPMQPVKPDIAPASAPPVPPSAQPPLAPAFTASHAVPGSPYMPPRKEQSVPAAAPVTPQRAPVPPPPAAPPRRTLRERLGATLPLEEILGMNIFAKIGIVLLVLGFALLGRMALISMGPGERVALIYALSAALLGGGIWLETKERYRLLGRAAIGGGWALLFFTTYALHHVAAMAVLASNTADCVLMLIVAIAMVAHTLRYQSQVVTGLAFLLAFSTVALSQDSVYALTAGVILAAGIVALALRMAWYELELFGILATYANHFYWLYKLYPDGFAGRPFPQFWPSIIILLLYWLAFRISYVARRIAGPQQETISTAAALLNTISLLAVMKFQSTHPELAFYALLALGAAEFIFGQVAAGRRRRTAFKLLTVVGTILIFAAVPFKFSGNSIALFWMIAAELLLAAGILQPEIVFRRLGSIAGALTGLLIIYESRGIIEFRRHSESALIQDGVLLLSTALLFCINAHFVRRRWNQFFQEMDAALADGQGWLGAVTAFFGVWALFPADSTVLGWAALFLAAAAGKRYLNDNHLLAQAWVFAAIVLFRCGDVNCHFDILYPHHVVMRLITLPALALAFYAAAWILSGVKDARARLRLLSLWAGSLVLSVLGWLDVSQPWVAPVWVAFAVALLLIARRIRLSEFNFQEHLLASAAVAQLAAVNLSASHALDRYLPFIGCAAAFYAISRASTLHDAQYRRVAAWSHTWAATALLAALAWHESPQPWLTAIWAVFALALAFVDRIFTVEELPWQAHLLALLAVLRAVTLNFYLTGRWHGLDLRLITVSILVVCLYCLARWVRLPESLRNTDAPHAYTWIASGLAAWLMWTELRPVAVAVAWAVFGLMLFEIAAWKSQRQLRWQSFAALAAAFARIFFVNLTADALPGESISPRIYTIVPLVLIYFYVWSRLRPAGSAENTPHWSAADLIAFFGTGSLAALLYFEIAPEWIIVSWATLALALMLAAWLLNKPVFLQQANLLVVGIMARSLAHNIFGASYFTAGGWRGRFSILAITAALLLIALPIAFRLRARYADRPITRIDRLLALHHPEQVYFFAPVALVAITIAIKMNPGMVTLSWAIEGVLVILLGLLVSQRSYRLTGLIMLLLCVAKIVARDAWLLGERDRYTTFIVLGAALTLVSMLYGKYRDTVRRLL